MKPHSLPTLTKGIDKKSVIGQKLFMIDVHSAGGDGDHNDAGGCGLFGGSPNSNSVHIKAHMYTHCPPIHV